jgi:hypothetical protein
MLPKLSSQNILLVFNMMHIYKIIVSFYHGVSKVL